MQTQIDTSSSAIDTDARQQPMSRDERVKFYTSKYEKIEGILKLDRDQEVTQALAELAREIEDLSSGKVNDQILIQVLFGNFLPKYFKLLTQKKYYMSDSDRQITVTQFINIWMKNRIPPLRYYFTSDDQNQTKDPVLTEIGFSKDIEIIDILFNGDSSYYDFKVSKNTSEIEDRLSRIFEALDPLSEDKLDMSKNEDGKPGQPIMYEVAYAKKPQYTSFYFVHNINVFNKYKGFEALINLIKDYKPTKSVSRQMQNVSLFKVSLTIMGVLIQMRFVLREDFWMKGFDYGTQIALACYDYVQNKMTQEDLRLVSKREIQFFSQNVESILDSVSQGKSAEEKVEIVYQISESIELEIALKCLQSPILEKKLAGHQILITQIQKVRNGNKQPSQRQGALNFNLQSMMTKKWLNAQIMLEWLEGNAIFDLVFGDSLHSEVIKKSYTLLDFLYTNGKITSREIEKMWECATKKHEAYKVAILKALAFLATKANLQDLKYLYSKIKTIPFPEVDKFCLDLIKSIAKKLVGDVSMGNIATQSRQNRNDGPIIGPLLPPLVRSSSGDRMTQKKKDDRLNNSFSNEINTGEKGDSTLMKGNVNDKLEPLGLNRVALFNTGRSQLKRNNSSPRAKEGANGFLQGPAFTQARQNRQAANLIDTTLQTQGRQDIGINQDLNPLEVPLDKEDKKTADEDISFNVSNEGNQDGTHDIFNTSLRDEQIQVPASQAAQKSKNMMDLEEEKEGGDPFSSGNQATLIINMTELLHDQTLGIEDAGKCELAHQVLDYLWSLCQEQSILQQGLSLQTHKQAIEDLVHLIQYNYQKSLINFIGRCVTCLTIHQSVMSMHVLIQRLIMTAQLPIDKSKILPTTRQELILALDQVLNMTNICLSSYIEFKRLSLNYIFDQMGSQEHEQENLETQSSLDNDDERSNSNIGQNPQMIQAHRQLASDQQNTPQSISETQPLKDLIHIQDDSLTAQSSSSMFVSPRMKAEEEFKQPKQMRTQSFREEVPGHNGILKNQNSDNTAATPNMRYPHEANADLIMNIERPTLQNTQSATINSSNNHNRLLNSQSKRQNPQGLQSRQEQFNNVGAGATTNQVQQPVAQLGQQNNNRDFLNSLTTNEAYKYTYYEELHLRLDFLKFLVGSSPQILKPQQIQILWECLVINAFYERERDQFFNWCTQILKLSSSIPVQKNSNNKDSATASDSIFNDDCLELLYFETLLKLDFRYITEVMYECFERYFIYINEQYGQIVTSSAFESAFEVYETRLIGIEALWEILLCARSTKVYKSATEFLHKIYKKMSPQLAERLNEIKEDLLQNCMEQIKSGYNQIKREIGGQEALYDLPIYHLSQSFEDPKNRIARSISQLCKFIDEFEGLRDKSAKSQLGAAEKEILVICNNNIGSSPQPKKIQIVLPLSTKIGVLREQVGNSIFPKRIAKEISLMHKGKELNEDMKNLKDLGVSQNDQQISVMVSLRNQLEMDLEMHKADAVQDDMALISAIETIKCFIGELGLPDAVYKLALQKCNMNTEEAVIMLTDEFQVNDLQEEVRRQEEATTNNNIVMIEEPKEEVPNEEAKLNLIISNRAEYFDLLFELLNLGISEITNAAWNLLVQIPVNKTLLHQIRTLSSIQEGGKENWCQIIDPHNTYKMLYSIQIVNSLISVNNEKLSDAEIQERYEWRLRFLELGGFEHLYSILITLEPDEFLSMQNMLQRQLMPTSSKKKGKANAQPRVNDVPNIEESKENSQIQNNQAKCLGFLISIVKIFIQAALLTSDEDRLLTLIVQSSTSPFRKPKTMKALQSVPQSKFNQLMFGANSGSNNIQGSLSDQSRDEGSRDTSSVHTPKFQSSHSSTPQCQTPKNEKENANDKGSVMNKSIDTNKAETIFSQQTMGVQGSENQFYTQVDDFPRLVEQISGSIAVNLLEKVINFNGLISKLLNIIYKAVMFCDSLEVSSLVQNSLDLLLPCIVWRPNLLLKEVYDFENLESLLIRTLMQNSNENVRKSIERTFKIICNENYDMSSSEQVQPPKVHILKILLKNLPDIETKSDNCEEFFNLITYLIKISQSSFKQTSQTAVLSEDQDNVQMIDKFSSNILRQKFFLEDGTLSSLTILQWCIYQLKMRPTFEDRYNQYTDKILAGYLQLTQSVLEINPSLKRLSTKTGYNLVKLVFDFLFLLPSNQNSQKTQQKIADQQHPKCKRKLTRKKAFNLLLTLCSHQEENFLQLLQELYAFHAQIQKSQKVVSLSEFDNEVGMRSGSGYVGLKNFGCTCYMNALIQQLFMIGDLRKGILEAEVSQHEIEENLLYQMKLIFANLQESEKQYYAPEGFTKSFKFYGEPVNVRQQQDTYEFLMMLFDNLENFMKGTQHEKLLQEQIGGIIGNETKSTEKEYPYVGEREENFFAISLDIKNKKSLQEALDLYIKPDHLEGDNKYHCEKHDRKIDATRRSYLKKLHNTVIINLKRFEFDYNTMQRIKLNDYCEFPEKINFKPWTKEGIRERERNQQNSNNQNDQQLDDEIDNESDQVSDTSSLQENSQSDDLDFIVEDQQENMQSKSKKQQKSKREKKNAAPIDEDLDSNDEVDHQPYDEEDEEDNMNSIMDTAGKYFDEGMMEDFIDIAADDYDEVDGIKKVRANSKNNDQSKAANAQNSKNGAKKSAKKIQDNKLKKKRTKKDDSYYEYELVGVLVHSGSADAGHYYSFIKERSNSDIGRWLEFNDTYVREFDIKNLGVECFGGNQEVKGPAKGFFDDFSPADARLFERCRNAYLLFYERVQKTKAKNESLLIQTFNQQSLDIKNQVYQRIWDENAAFMKLKLFFDQEYFQFAREYIGLYNFENVLSFDNQHSQTFKIQSLIESTENFLKEMQTNNNGEELRKRFINTQFEILAKSQGYPDFNIFSNGFNPDSNIIKQIETDPGLHAIKLATILSFDIMLKVKDMQSFVSWMQIMDQLYQRHDIACVWLIKYVTENRRILEELLIETTYFEVRESFAKLLITALGVAAKNEERYMFKTDDVLFFTGSSPSSEGSIERIQYSRSAVCRFIDVFFGDHMLDKVLRYNWRKFDEYFQVLASFVQTGFEQTKYIIQNKNAITKLLEFVMNSSAPFSSNKQRMGDHMQEPNFTQANEILSILICSCFTKGIKFIKEYSPLSRYQEEDQHIDLEQVVGTFLPLLTPSCFTQDLLIKASPLNDSLLKIVLHLSWGDLETSQFFIDEVIMSVKGRRSSKDIEYHLKIIEGLMTMNDIFQNDRLEMILLFESHKQAMKTVAEQQFGAPYQSRSKSIIMLLENMRYTDQTYVLTILSFFGRIACLSDKTQTVMKLMKENKSIYQSWIQSYLINLHGSVRDHVKNLKQVDIDLILQNVSFYSEIFDDPNALAPHVYKAENVFNTKTSVSPPSAPQQIVDDDLGFISGPSQNEANYDFEIKGEVNNNLYQYQKEGENNGDQDNSAKQKKSLVDDLD